MSAAMLERITLAHMPPELAVYTAFCCNVQNSAFLRSQLLAGNRDFEYAFIDASMILSRKHILAATFRAMNDYLNGRLKSHNIHSEIVFSLSPNNNIGEAFRRFGLSDSTTDVLVIKIATIPSVTFESVQNHLADAIVGTPIRFDDTAIQKVSDITRIRKVYKINIEQPPKNKKVSHQLVNGDAESISEEERKAVEAQVLGIMALRGTT